MNIHSYYTASHGAELISTTDKDGRITYANQAFCEVAGYSLEELVNQHHNIVRHPEMPKLAFADMWRHLKQGQVWRGAVKNITKDGRYYWVDAFVCPIYQGQQVIGYQSVRVRLNDSYKHRAIHAYKKLVDTNKCDTTINRFFPHKLLAVGAASIASTYLAFTLSPFFTLLPPIAMCTLFYQQLFQHRKWESGLALQYDSLSRLIFCQESDRSSEFHLKIEQGRVRTILGRLIDSSKTISNNANELSEASSEAKRNIDHEFAEISAVSVAIEEMTNTISDIAANSVLTSDKVNQASEECTQAIESIEVTRNQVDSMASEVKQSANIASELVAEAEQVNSIMTEIQAISEQTNLLALNAAIEAARAGEYGRGFAVVADEVRTLSTRTGQATEHIQNSIVSIQNTLRKLETRMNENEKVSQNCVEDTQVSEQKVRFMASALTEISDIAIQNSTAAEEQSIVSREISANIQRISDVSNANLTQVETVSQLADSLLKSAENLNGISYSFGNRTV
ncbi:methyl-accepting chemotaxis protein [Vibrio paucivorans]